jgi:hypothetical protein
MYLYLYLSLSLWRDVPEAGGKRRYLEQPEDLGDDVVAEDERLDAVGVVLQAEREELADLVLRAAPRLAIHACATINSREEKKKNRARIFRCLWSALWWIRLRQGSDDVVHELAVEQAQHLFPLRRLGSASAHEQDEETDVVKPKQNKKKKKTTYCYM